LEFDPMELLLRKLVVQSMIKIADAGMIKQR